MIKVSVIIPIYNVENFLKECLDSIINQTLNEIEIICVNDGSTDNSFEILKEYQKKDNRISVITQKNQGHAIATNLGMKLAKGKYLYLMDADDFLKLDALEKLYNIAEEKKVDMVIFKAINYDNVKKEYYESEQYTMSNLYALVGEKIFNFDDLKDNIFDISVAPWNKLYNRDFIEKIGIKFPEGLIFDDNIFFWELLFSAKKLYFLNEYLFCRRWHISSSTQKGDKRFIDSLIIATMLIDLFKHYNMFDEYYKKELYNMKISMACYRFQDIQTEYKELYFDEMQKIFFDWLKEDNLYDNLQNFLTHRNKYLLDVIISSNNSNELEILIDNYDSKLKYNKLYKKNKNELKRKNQNIRTKFNLLKN